jgi:hypothetical protein
MMDFGGGKSQDKKFKLLLVGAGVLIVVLALVAGILFWKYTRATDDTGEAKSKEVIAQVEEIFILPKGEKPTVATVQDLDKLKGQEFFADAKNGDYVLVYTDAQVAFLYRESEGKLVNVGPIKTENDATGQTPVSGQ